MAKTLKNTGLAAQIAWILAVDDDGAIKGWKTPGAVADWTSGAGLTLGGGGSAPSVVSGTWQGVTKDLIRLPEGGDITIDTAVSVDTPYCLFIITRNSNVTWSSVNRKIMGAANSATGAYDSAKPVLTTVSGPTVQLQQSEGSYYLSRLIRTFGAAENYSAFFCALNAAAGDSPTYYGVDGAAITAISYQGTNGNATTQTGVFWRFISPESGFDGDVVAIGCLRQGLSIAEADSIHQDPIGLLFSSASAPVITGPTGAAGAGSITHTVNENSNAAGTWTATSSVSWSLTGTDAAELSISGGVVTKASGNFDYETKASYSFNVVNGSATQAVTLNITNLPELSVPTKNTPTSATAVVGATVDVASGTLYAVLTLDNSAPSVAQVKAGQDSAGSSATTVAPTPLTITSAGAKSFAAATVVAGTTRYGWIVLESGGNDSTVLAVGAVYPGTGRPVTDVSVAGWTPTGAASAAAALNEDSPGNDAEYITSPALSGVASTASMTLDKTYPAGTYSIKVRAGVDAGAGNLVVRLLNDSDVSQGVTANQALNTTPTTYTLSITTTGEATRIRVEVTS